MAPVYLEHFRRQLVTPEERKNVQLILAVLINERLDEVSRGKIHAALAELATLLYLLHDSGSRVGPLNYEYVRNSLKSVNIEDIIELMRAHAPVE